MWAEHFGYGQKWLSFAHFCATGISSIRAQCWLQVQVATSVFCRIFAAPGAKANAVRPHEPSVTLSQLPEYCLALMVTAVSATSVTAYLSLRHYDVHSDTNCWTVQLFSCPLLLVSFCDRRRRFNPDEQRTLVQTNRTKRNKLFL